MRKIACLGVVVAACAADFAANLPAGYRELEYVQAAGAQWVNTGVTPAATDVITAKVWFPATDGNNHCIWCARGTSGTDRTFTCFLIGTKLRFDRNNNTSAANAYVLPAATECTLVANGSTLAATVNGESAGTMQSGNFTPPNPICLFASYTTSPGSGLGNYSSHRLYSFSVDKADGTPRCAFVPALRVSDGEIGLYDTVNGAFATNSGSGALLAGPVACANTYTWAGGAGGSLNDAANWSPAPAGAFTADDELVFNDAAEITLSAPATVGRITLNAAGNVSFAATAGTALTVFNVRNDGAGTATFACPVQFATTWYVEQAGAVKFPGGATATHPDPALRTDASTDQTRTLDGDFTFTEDWVVNSVGDKPWIIPSGSTVHGRLFTGTQTAHHRILRVEEGASAYFTCVSNGWNMGDVDIDGYVEVSGEWIVQTSTSGSTAARFGRAGNTGTVKAHRIAKNRNGIASQLIPNLIVGAGGFGSLTQDYYWRVDVDATVTFTDDGGIYGVYNSSSPLDWGIYLNTVTMTVDVPEGKTVTWSSGVRATSGSAIRKTGAGTLVMTDTDGSTSGFKKTHPHDTLIDEGTVRVAASDQMGTGSVTVADGARLEIAGGVTFSNVASGDGTLGLENGATLEIGFHSLYMGAVEVAPGATVNVTLPDGLPAPHAVLTGVSASDLARFALAGDSLAVVGDALVWKGNAAGAGTYVWNGASGGDWSAPGNWLVDGAAPATAPGSGDAILFQNDAALTVGGTGTLSVTKIITLSDAEVTFSCPVQFAGTYLVNAAARPPRFAGGATATYPDASLTDANAASHTLNGAITFTEDWTIPLQASGNPFVVADGSALTGTTVTAETNSTVSLTVGEGAVATFDDIAIAGKLIFKLAGGRLVANGDITVGGSGSPRSFGSSTGNIGTVEANGIYKSVTSNGHIDIRVTNIVVGAGGFGMYRKDFSFRFYVDSRLTAKDDMTIHQPIASDGPKDTDWGLNLNAHTLTVDTAGHTVTFDSYTHATDGVLVKEGAGEMVMQSRQKKHTGGTIMNGGLTTVKTAGALGYCTATVNDGATLRFADAALAHAYPIEVNAGGTLAHDVSVDMTAGLTFRAGAILKPAQNTYFVVSDGLLALPDEGTVTVDMTGFTFVNGVATPVLAGVAAGDEAKFAALVPAGVGGAFSVADGFLYYTATSGGGAAANLFWHPAGEAVWSGAVAAWTNAAGEQVAFSPYANATVADAATISLPANVDANDVMVSADGDVTLDGAGKLGGPGTVVKTGAGTFTFNATGGLDAQPVIVSNGVFRLGDDLPARALGSSADSSPIVVARGGTLDINYTSTNNYDVTRHSLTHDKLIRIAGDGVDGKGAIVSTNKQCYIAFSDVELTDDATIGGTVRSDFRHSTAYGSVRGTTSNSLTGPGKCLTVKNTAMLALVGTTVDLGSIVVAEGANLRAEANTADWNLDEGVKLRGGTFSMYGTTCDAKISVVAESGSNTIVNGNGTATVNGPVTVAPGATLTQTGGSILYNGPISGDFDTAGGTVFLGSALRDGLVLNCTKTGGSGSDRSIRLRQGGTFSNVDITCRQLGVADQSNSVVNVTFLDSTLDISRLFLGWGTAWMDAYMSIGAGTELTAGLICLAYTGTATNRTKSVLSVDGGTVHHTGTDFFICQNGPNADFILNAGTVTVDQATIRLRSGNTVLGGYNSARFIQNGGAFNYGGDGFTARFEDNSDGGQIVLTGGDFNAATSWSIPFYIPLFFGYESTEGWTLNQADGTTATWTTALLGNGDVTLNGTATLVGTNEMQGAVGGKWTVGDGFTAGLEGAASLLGGLALGEGATATVDIATNRSAVFTARDFGHNPGSANGDKCITNRFSRAIGGTTRGTITHNETLLFRSYTSAVRPFGDMSYQSTYAVGDFYVEDSAAGTWSFSASCDDWAFLWIDGEQVGVVTSKTWTATKELTTGWHAFRHVTIDNSGTFGGARTVGYKYGSMSAYANFSVKNLKMRPAADFGDPDNANTVRWSHYKGTSAKVGSKTNLLWKDADFDWDFCCITNNLQMLKWYGKGNDYMCTNTVNRYDGWFLVTEENADKPWTFRTSYDDCCALWIDGVDTGLIGTNNTATTETYTTMLGRGWHSFRIQTVDFSGNAGPWSGTAVPVSYKVADGPQTLFSEATLQLTVCPDGYVQGGVTLASGATLRNGAAENAATVYGEVAGTGTGAKLAGPFKFAGGTLAFRNVAPNTADLADVLAFENPAADMLADVDAIIVDYAAAPTRGRIPVCPLYGLTEEAAKAKFSVTVAGEPADHIAVKVENGVLTIRNTKGTVLFFR